jgi:SAM-dependent methyltransferase
MMLMILNSIPSMPINPTTDNPVFYENLIQNYIYKGPVEEWYIRIKVKMEDNYRLFNRLVPVKGQITDIGCGFGPLCYMLSQLSEEREITGIDYDEDKIAVAQQGWLRTPHLQFVCANALEYPLPESDVFILNGVLIINPVEPFFIHPLDRQLVHDPEIAEILIHDLSFIQTADIVNAGIHPVPAALVSLEAAAKQFIFLQHTDVIALFA